ncbi:MAG: c-type cytochrome biogenesis protein CcmI [Rhodospirillales bacterium]|nr:c-type cytochrome biogenesis protein CcmI [Rhodospirillales bacterium]
MMALAFGILGLAALALAPLGFTAFGQARARGRRESALALLRGQLVELDRDRAEGRIGTPEHAAARLEVERRLLAEAERAEPAVAEGGASPVWIAVALVPIAALALYWVGGSPELPAAPLAERIAAAEARGRQEMALIAQLKAALPRLDPASDKARQGYVLLGNAEARLGDMMGAADAWRKALASRFDPTLAAETAEAITEANGHVTPEAEALFRRALATAPSDAPWRSMVERRLGGG